MFGVSLAARPHFVQQQRAGRLDGPVNIVRQAAFFSARRANQRPQFRLEQRLLPFARTQYDDERYCLFRKLPSGRSARSPRPATGLPADCASHLALRHVGRIVSQIAPRASLALPLTRVIPYSPSSFFDLLASLEGQ